MHTHIIYYTTYKDVIVYIGAGQPNRYKHTTSGVSHVYQLNKLHFTDPENVNTTILKGCVSLEAALEEETKLIKEFKPKFNNFGLSSDERYSINKKEIEKYAGDITYFVNVRRMRKGLTKYEAIKRVLTPSVRTAIEYYSNPETDNEVLYKAFPLFKEWLDSGVTIAMMRACKMNKSLIIKKTTQTRTIISNTDEVKAQLNLQVGKIYTRDELLVKVLDVYESLDISVEKPKATDIKRWYEIKNSPKKLKGETISAYKIIKEL